MFYHLFFLRLGTFTLTGYNIAMINAVWEVVSFICVEGQLLIVDSETVR